MHEPPSATMTSLQLGTRLWDALLGLKLCLFQGSVLQFCWFYFGDVALEAFLHVSSFFPFKWELVAVFRGSEIFDIFLKSHCNGLLVNVGLWWGIIHFCWPNFSCWWIQMMFKQWHQTGVHPKYRECSRRSDATHVWRPLLLDLETTQTKGKGCSS